MIRKFIICILMIIGLSASLGLLNAQSQAPTPATLGAIPAQAQAQNLRLTVLYDNIVYDNRYKSDWGFAALIEYGGRTLLFDSGAKGAILLENMKKLDVDLKSIEMVVLSHAHTDHIGGLDELLKEGIRPTVYMLSSFPNYLKESARHQTGLVEIEKPLEIIPGIFTTGSININNISEQGLVIRTRSGAVILTGCAHPGLLRIVDKAQEIMPGKIVLLAGGFHLLDKNAAELRSIINQLGRKEIEEVMPSHCTGDKAISMFQKEFAGDFVKGGVGRVMVIR